MLFDSYDKVTIRLALATKRTRKRLLLMARRRVDTVYGIDLNACGQSCDFGQDGHAAQMPCCIKTLVFWTGPKP